MGHTAPSEESLCHCFQVCPSRLYNVRLVVRTHCSSEESLLIWNSLDAMGWFERAGHSSTFSDDKVYAFSCHDAGAACLAHATQHQLLLSAGKKGLVGLIN